jgi:enoyl-CoA hydratase
MLQQLEEAWIEISKVCTVAIFSSTGHRAFCAGADLNELRKRSAKDAEKMHSQSLFEQISQSPITSIAAVHGAAVAGGCELALCCDLRVLGPQASFSLPEVSLGLIPSAGGCTRLPQLVGISRAKAVILGGLTIRAQQAVEWGLATSIVSDPLAEAHRWAKHIAGFDSTALALAKSVLSEPSLEEERRCEAILYDRQHRSN